MLKPQVESLHPFEAPFAAEEVPMLVYHVPLYEPWSKLLIRGLYRDFVGAFFRGALKGSLDPGSYDPAVSEAKTPLQSVLECKRCSTWMRLSKSA